MFEFGQSVRHDPVCDLPVVLDADGLNLLAEHGFSRDNWILTPHPGEAARLLGASSTEVQRDRFAAARELAKRFDAVVVLKGAGSLVADPAGRVALWPFGNPAMATAGMGDVLTGVVASLVGQGAPREERLFEAACARVVTHALAGDRAAGRSSTEPQELDSIGLGDLIGPRSALLVEWPERAGGRLPAATRRISLVIDGERRQVQVEEGPGPVPDCR